MAVQMTRAEYEAKYGTAPVVSTKPALETEPAPVKMTRAEYDLKYGQKSKLGLFGNPLETVQESGKQVESAISGTGENQGKSSLERGFKAAGAAAMAVPSVVADVIPGGKAVSDVLGKATESVIGAFGNSANILASAAEKVGLMTPEQRKKYDENNAAFAGTPVGIAIESAASIGKSSGDIANVILMADGTARGAQDFIDNKAPVIKTTIENIPEKWNDARQLDAIKKTADEIATVENKYVSGRKANRYAKDAGAPSRERIAQSGVLKYSVDEDGLIRTTVPGGAVEQYRAMNIKPVESVVRDNLVREGGKTNLSVVKKGLEDAIYNSGLEGADLKTALNGVQKEIAGLRLKADELGYVPNELLHDAKINTTSNINYQTPPEVSKYRKAIARGYKTLVEENSNVPVKKINEHLAPLYEDINRLESLDGRRAPGGRLGKYAAQISGNIVGGAFGSFIGGPLGMAAGTVVGGEVASLIKGKTMAKTFTRDTGSKAVVSPFLTEQATIGKSPRLMLPTPKTEFRTTVPSGETINLPGKAGGTQ